MDAIIQNMVLFNSSIRRYQQRQKGQETLITTHTKLWLPCSRNHDHRRQGSQVSLNEKWKCSSCVLFSQQRQGTMTQAQDTASKRKRRINHFARVLSMHTKEGGCMSGTLNHQKPSYVTLSCSFPKGQARRRESSTLCRVEDTLSHLVTASTFSKSWILTT